MGITIFLASYDLALGSTLSRKRLAALLHLLMIEACD